LTTPPKASEENLDPELMLFKFYERDSQELKEKSTRCFSSSKNVIDSFESLNRAIFYSASLHSFGRPPIIIHFGDSGATR
jgi:phosphoenolpyruvate carboxylase